MTGEEEIKEAYSGGEVAINGGFEERYYMQLCNEARPVPGKSPSLNRLSLAVPDPRQGTGWEEKLWVFDTKRLQERERERERERKEPYVAIGFMPAGNRPNDHFGIGGTPA